MTDIERGWGRALVEAAFPELDADPLFAAVEALADAHEAKVVRHLVNEIQTEEWQRARSAIGNLRRMRPEGVLAVPAVTGVLSLTVGKAEGGNEQFSQREAALALDDWRSRLDELVEQDGPLKPPARTLREFMDQVAEPEVVRLLLAPTGAARRGALRFLQKATGDVARALDAVSTFLDDTADDERDGEAASTRATAITTLREIHDRLPKKPPPGDDEEATGTPETNPPRLPIPPTEAPDLSSVDPAHRGLVARSFVEDGLVPALIRELRHGSPTSRRAALSALGRLGDAALPSVPAMWRLLHDTPDDDAAMQRLRQEAMVMLAQMVSAVADTAPGEPATGTGISQPAHARATLVRLAECDPSAEVRAAAVKAMGLLATSPRTQLDVALTASEDDDETVRATAAELLVQLANRSGS